MMCQYEKNAVDVLVWEYAEDEEMLSYMEDEWD